MAKRRVGLVTLVLAALLLGTPSRAGTVEPDPTVTQQRLSQTLSDLAALGYKRAGTPGGQSAGDYVFQRFVAAGLANVRFESFQFPSFELASSTLAITVNANPVAMAHDVFAYSGAGHVDADIVYVGTGHPSEYQGINATGKVVLLKRDPSYHRSSQYTEVIAHGGAAMLYVSQSPNNLIQIGTVADPEDGLGAIPAITIGKVDGEALIRAVTLGSATHAVIDVAASIVPAIGRNVTGVIAGTDPSGAYLLVGAHYDTWQIGSADNSTGVAAMIELAEDAVRRGSRRYGIVFVGYDAEEQGLFGGYDYLRDHVIVGREPMLAFVNLEIPGSGPTDLRALGRTEASPIDEDLDAIGIRNIYQLVVDMKLVPLLFGGIIPTDIQGMYWYGLQGFSTACDTPFYHTIEDTPDKLDIPFLADAVNHFKSALTSFMAEPVPSYTVRDDSVWKIDLSRTPVPGGLRVDVRVTDTAGWPRQGATLDIWLDVDDFTRAFRASGQTDALGRASFVVPASALLSGQGSRFIHVTAGIDYPLAENIMRVASAVQP